MEGILKRIDEIKTRIHILSDNRKISYIEFGVPNGIPVLYFHGSPGSKFEGLFTEKASIAHGFHTISCDRPGFGDSDFKKKYTLLDNNKDLLELVDFLGFNKFGAVGVSGGATTALALAYEIPNRLLFVADVCGWAPIYKTGLQKHMAPLDRFFSKIARISPKLFRFPFSYMGKKAKSSSPESYIKMIESSFSESDTEMIKEEWVADFLIRDSIEAFKQGGKGPAWDAILRYLNWGFKLSDIDAKINIFYGTDDKFVPLPFVEYKKENLNDWESTEYENKGHFHILTKFNEIFSKIYPYSESKPKT